MRIDRDRVPIEVGLLLHQVYSLATHQLTAALRPMQLSSRHVSVMFLIRDGVQTQRDLVARLHTDKTGMVRVVDELERLGYVSRTPSAHDRRVTILALTAAGADVLRTAQVSTSGVADQLFAPVASDDLIILKQILERILAGNGVSLPPTVPHDAAEKDGADVTAG